MDGEKNSADCERPVSRGIKWADLDWPNADNLDRVRRRARRRDREDRTSGKCSYVMIGINASNKTAKEN